MISGILKRIAQKTMMSSSPDSFEAEMNSAAVEDLDFKGLDPAGQSPEERCSGILAAMTTEEKLDYITGYKSLGIKAVPRLGLPSVWMSDATSGVRSYGKVTAFPSAVAMTASWDTQLIARAADHIAETARAKGISILLGPGVNIARVPTCGRNFEYMGEDPFLAGRMASAYIRACSDRKVICTVKHLAANNSDYDRHKVSSDLDERSLREIYLPAFEMAVKEGSTPALMSSYNPINGIWASENRKLLTDILRDEWGFEGFVISDWNSLYSTAGPLTAGLDLEMPGPKWLSARRVKRAISEGEATESDLDRMAGNLMKTLFAYGVYDRPVVDIRAREFCPEHEKAALETALAAPVLLKNENSCLPLPVDSGSRIVVCGPHGIETPVMGGGSCHIARTTGKVDLLEGLKNTAGSDVDIIYIPWRRNGRLNSTERSTIESADAVVIACGFDYLEESELYDRAWMLPTRQRLLIRAVSSLNSRNVVVLTAGGGVETASWINDVSALVHGMYLGQYVGKALAELLFGRINFRGRLPFSMARRWDDIPATKNYPRRFWTTSPGRMTLSQGNPKRRRVRHWQYREKLMVGYRHFTTSGVAPAYPFGCGLSYTSFSIEGLSVSSTEIRAGDELGVTVRVKNTGNRAGVEVVQIYVSDVESRLPRPARELKGFAAVKLEAGEQQSVSINLPAESFRYWDSESGSGWVIEPGKFRIIAGQDSMKKGPEKTITISD